MRLIFLHQYFHPEIAGSAIRFTELALGLTEEGFKIDVYTGFPKISGFSTSHFQKINTLTIHRLPQTRLDKNKSYGRVVNGITFFVFAFWKLLGTEAQTPIFIGSDPPFLCFLGWSLKRLKGQKYILQISDLYPDIATELGYLKKEGLFHKLWRKINEISFREAEAIVTLGSLMRNRILNYLPVEEAWKVQVIENWESETIKPLPKTENPFAKQHELVHKTVVLYSGNMGLTHGLNSLLEAAQRLKHEPGILFLMIGGGKERARLQVFAEKENLTNILFLPYQNQEMLPYSLTAGDISFISMKHGTEGTLVPGKLYTALAAGSAILGMASAETEVARIVSDSRCGIVVDSENVEQIAQAILNLHRDQMCLREFQKNARLAFDAHYTKTRALQEYKSLFQTVLGHISSEPSDSLEEKYVFESKKN